MESIEYGAKQAIEISFAKPEEISLETIVKIQQSAFEDSYLEKNGENILEYFDGCSFMIASDKNKIVAYSMFATPEDQLYPAIAKIIEKKLEFRKELLEGKADLSWIIENLKKSSGLDIDESNHQIRAFEGKISLDKTRDVYFAERAVLPKFRGRGIATEMIKAVMEKTGSKKPTYFVDTRRGTAMERIYQRLDFNPFLQYGPALRDGTVFVQMAYPS